MVKEWRRHAANRGGIAFGLLLITAAVLLSVFAPPEGGSGSGGGTSLTGVRLCYLEYDRKTPLVEHLEANVPASLRRLLMVRPLARADRVNDLIVYPSGTAAIQIRHLPPEQTPSGRPVLSVSIWHPNGDPQSVLPFERWLWKELYRGWVAQAREQGLSPGPEPDYDADDLWLVSEAHKRLQERLTVTNGSASRELVPDLIVRRQGLAGKVLDIRTALSTGLIVFALYFSCVYLLPTMTCEERERGVLLAQALSPASPGEIVAAKFLFYPTLGLVLATTLAAVHDTAILSRLYFWLAAVAVGGGFLGIGMTIATLARTQRAAFLGGMCYLLGVSMVLLICSLNHIPFLPWLAVEYHGPRVLHAAVSGEVLWYHWYNLLAAFGLAAVWLIAAAWLFRKRGWQ